MRIGTVLAVDDEPDMLLAMVSVLSCHDFRVIEATTGDSALEIWRRERPVATVLDHVLPGRYGLEVACEIRREDPLHPVVLCSASVDRDLALAARAAGLVVLSKFDLDRIGTTLETMLADLECAPLR